MQIQGSLAEEIHPKTCRSFTLLAGEVYTEMRLRSIASAPCTHKFAGLPFGAVTHRDTVCGQPSSGRYLSDFRELQAPPDG